MVLQTANERLAGFEMPAGEMKSLHTQLGQAASSEVQGMARTAADTVLVRMNQRWG